MSYTLERLRMMPMNLLQGIDIKTKEEEDLVQKVLDEKRASMPVMIDLNIPSSMTDNMTGEKEAKLQAEIDAKKAEARAKFVHTDVSDETTTLEPIISSEKKPFCQFCDSKGVRHKKNCTRVQ